MEKKTLEDWILSLNTRGLPPRIQMVIKYMVYAKSGQLVYVDNSLVKYVRTQQKLIKLVEFGRI